MLRLSGALLALAFIACPGSSPAAVSITSGLIGYWPADGDGRDLSGFGRDLTLYGGLDFGEGVAGQAFHFGTNSARHAARTVDDAALDFGTADFTLQVWANFATLSGEHTLIEKFTGPGGPGWTLTQPSDRNLQFFAGGSAIIDTSISGFAANTWHHILVRRSSNAFALYFDGLLRSTNTSNPNIDTGQPLRIGNRHGGQAFPMAGRIDEAAIWNRGLSDAEIATLYEQYASTPPTPTPGPLVWSTAVGGNGHAYEFIPAQGIAWDAARQAAATRTFRGVGGHLATATSAAENQFLKDHILDSQSTHGIANFIEAWLGGYQNNPAGPANQSWTWVTGEPWRFTNWDFDEPNDTAGGEQYLGIWGPHGDGPLGRWNDQGGPGDPHAAGNIQGYIVEYAIPEPSAIVLTLQLAFAVAASRRGAIHGKSRELKSAL